MPKAIDRSYCIIKIINQVKEVKSKICVILVEVYVIYLLIIKQFFIMELTGNYTDNYKYSLFR